MDAVLEVDLVDDLAQLLLAHQAVDLQRKHLVQAGAGLAADVLRDDLVEQQQAQRAVDDLAALLAVKLAFQAHPDGGLQAQLAQLVGHHGLVGAGEHAARALAVGPVDGQVVAADDHVLRRRHDGLAVLGLQNVVVRQHEEAGLGLRLHRKGHVNGHLVAVEVGVVGGTHQRVELERLALHQHRLKGLDAQAVQRRRAVEQHRVLLDDLLEDVPHLGTALFDHALGVLAVVRLLERHQPLDHEGLEQLEGHFLGQAALVELELRADDDHRAAGVVHALAQQVLPEAALLAAQEVGQGLERAVAGAGHGTAAAAVVDERVHGLLEHALFVSDDDVRRAQLKEPL